MSLPAHSRATRLFGEELIGGALDELEEEPDPLRPTVGRKQI